MPRIFPPPRARRLGWIVTLTRRRGIDRLRKRQAYQRAEERLQHEPEQQPEAWVHNRSDDDIEHSDQRRILFFHPGRAAPRPSARPSNARFFMGMSQREIAVHTNIPLGTVKTRLELGLRKVSEALKGLKDEF